MYDPWPPNVGAYYWETLSFYQCGGWNGNCHTEGYDFYNIKGPPLKIPKLPLLVAEQPILIPPEEIARALAGDPDPTKAVRWGSASETEMMDGWIEYVDAPASKTH